MKKIWFTKIAIVLALSVLVFRCGDPGETKHYKFIANAEWSPTISNRLVISKEEFDAVVGKKSGCSNDVEDTPPPAALFELFLADTTGNISKQLTTNLGLAPPFKMKWSPRGDRFLIWGNPYPALGIIDTSGNITGTDSLGYASDADWSPDGSHIVCSAIRRSGGGTTNLYTVDATTGRSTRLLSDTIRTGAVSWSSQNKIACAFAGSTSAILAIIDTNGSNFLILDSTAYFNTIRWSPDGTKLLFTRNIQSTYDIYVLTISSSLKQLLLGFADGTQIPSLRYSPDGAMISFYTYQSGNFTLYTMGSDGSTPTSVATQSTDGSWSPDSKSLAYVNNNVVYTKRVQ